MSTYVFKAMDVTGAQASGQVEADTKQAVADQLKQRGLIVLDISAKHGSKELNLDLFQRVKLTDLAVFTRQLATMITSGMTILRALYVLEAQTQNKKLTETLIAVRKDVEAGLALSDALARHPKIFSKLFVAMARAGETGGVLDQSLERVADQLEKEDSLRRQVKSAMMYPTVVMTFALAVLIALVTFLIPVFVGVFNQFPQPNGQPVPLPPITQFTVGLSSVMTHQWYLIIGGVAALVVAFTKWKGSERGKRQWDAIRLRFPFQIGSIVQKISIARWSRTLSALVSAGVPILQALEITGETAGNEVIHEAMEKVIANVKAGGLISEPLKSTPVFPTMVSHMVGVGEETGALDQMLAKIADFYEDQVDAAVKTLTSVLEPVMIIVVGGMVGFIVISMYLPLFKVYDAIK